MFGVVVIVSQECMLDLCLVVVLLLLSWRKGACALRLFGGYGRLAGDSAMTPCHAMPASSKTTRARMQWQRYGTSVTKPSQPTNPSPSPPLDPLHNPQLGTPLQPQIPQFTLNPAIPLHSLGPRLHPLPHKLDPPTHLVLDHALQLPGVLDAVLANHALGKVADGGGAGARAARVVAVWVGEVEAWDGEVGGVFAEGGGEGDGEGGGGDEGWGGGGWGCGC